MIAVHALFEIDEGVVGPESGLDVLARDEAARLVDQETEELEGLRLKADLTAVLEQTLGVRSSSKEPKRTTDGLDRMPTPPAERSAYH